MEQLGHPPTLEFLLFLHKNFVWKYMRNTKLMVDKATLSFKPRKCHLYWAKILFSVEIGPFLN